MADWETKTHPRNSARKYLRLLIGAAIVSIVIFVLLLVAEVLIGNHDRSKSKWTRPGAIHVEGGTAKPGLNRRKFQEIRFRARDMKIYLSMKQISVQEANMMPETIRGRFVVTSRGSDYCAFDFKIAEEKIVDALSDVTASPEPHFSFDSIIDVTRRIDRDYIIIPATEMDKIGFAKLSGHSFEVGEEMQMDISLEGSLPRTASFVFVYCRAPKSLLHGYLLAKPANRILSAFGFAEKQK